MKRAFLFVSLTASIAGALLAQSVIDGRRVNGKPWSYDPKTVPPLAVPEAYAMAVLLAVVSSRRAVPEQHC